MKSFYLSLFILFYFSSTAQVDYKRTHWAFGRNALLSFDDNGIADAGTLPINGYRGTACFSNKQGDLVLNTNGNAVYGRDNELLAVLFDKAESLGQPDAIIIPKNEEETKFYIFIIEEGKGLRTVDVDLDSKSVTLRPDIFNESGYAFKLTAVKHCFSDAYWLILPDNASTFYSFLVKPNSISEPVLSTVASDRGNVGDFVSSHYGTKLALSSYLGDWAEIYDFDKKCGIVSNPRNLKKIWDTDNKPHGISFSPDDKSVYVAWSHQKSNLYQYDLENWGSVSNAVQSQENINDVLIGIDGHLYMNVHENGIPSRRIHVVRNPNNKGGGGTSRAIEDIATLPLGTNGAFEFPTFISSHTGGGCGEVGNIFTNRFRDNGNRCTNQQVYFFASIVRGTYDSIRWDLDGATITDYQLDSSRSGNTNISLKGDFPDERNYKVRCFAFHCSLVDTFYFPLEMKHPQKFSLGNDTTLCFGASIVIEVPLTNSGSFVWSDGDLNYQRTVGAGVYEARVSFNGCEFSDTITINQQKDIWTELNEEYYICDIESETQLLDAGKGFKTYKWTPTGDTTQWIEVRKLGEYIVVVNAYNGCQGMGSTVVKRRCDITYYIPNAFTPNGDLHNNTFKAVGTNIEHQKMKIYNRWGEKIYEGSEWDGFDAIAGVYFYTIQISGFQQKTLIRKIETGVVHLIR